MHARRLFRTLLTLHASLVCAAAFAQPLQFAAANCATPPVVHCANEGCVAADLGELGNAVEPGSGRAFFLDYPCDLRAGEKVIFILSLHGAGSIGNWQRHYFPAVDFKDRYRLVIATPTAGTAEPLRMWTGTADDTYLQGIVDLVTTQVGRDNIASFWLVGHSQDGMTANRLVCTPYFRDKVDGWLSLSGGRIGPVKIPDDFFGEGGPPPTLNDAFAESGAGFGRAAVPDCDFSFIFTAGEKEIVALPETSPWAEKYGCDARERGADIIDERKGYVESNTPGRPASWGRAARPGSAHAYSWPACSNGRVVADVVRLDKGHTEGLEPQVTEHLVQLISAAPGGKLQMQKGNTP